MGLEQPDQQSPSLGGGDFAAKLWPRRTCETWNKVPGASKRSCPSQPGFCDSPGASMERDRQAITASSSAASSCQSCLPSVVFTCPPAPTTAAQSCLEPWNWPFILRSIHSDLGKTGSSPRHLPPYPLSMSLAKTEGCPRLLPTPNTNTTEFGTSYFSRGEEKKGSPTCPPIRDSSNE